MPMAFDNLAIGAAYSRDQLAAQWARPVAQRFFVAHDGRIALFATRDNGGGGWGNEVPWVNALDETTGEFFAEVRPEREDINQSIRGGGDVGEMALFYRVRSPAPFTYRGLVVHDRDEGGSDALWLVLRLLGI